ncbi:hypothetical protein D9C73_025475 [Collichthys lucidus]|uniref:UPAR/Ly6 domain-containing protein n=1 Tax=Collichthys lucidus TaxID=240159 RepID=A0A4U5VUB7_COLLU|nr:hypothetical protein D9C73_025475 [Collichthys lucidus]
MAAHNTMLRSIDKVLTCQEHRFFSKRAELMVKGVRTFGQITTVTVYKNCSSLQSCLTALALKTEWSVNLGFVREVHTQMCCISDNCNIRTLATTSGSTEVLQLGCISRNLCNIQAVMNALFGAHGSITCGAPWSIRISAMLLTFALTVHKVLI